MGEAEEDPRLAPITRELRKRGISFVYNSSFVGRLFSHENHTGVSLPLALPFSLHIQTHPDRLSSETKDPIAELQLWYKFKRICFPNGDPASRLYSTESVVKSVADTVEQFSGPYVWNKENCVLLSNGKAFKLVSPEGSGMSKRRRVDGTR